MKLDVKKRKKEEDAEFCDAVEGCRELDTADLSTNRKVMDITKSFIRDMFRRGEEEDGGENCG